MPKSKKPINALPPADFAVVAAWIEQKQVAQADESLERAVAAGRFDAMAERALNDAAAGKAVSLG